MEQDLLSHCGGGGLGIHLIGRLNITSLHIQSDLIIPQIVKSRFGLSWVGMMDPWLLDSFSNVLAMGCKPRSHVVNRRGKT